MTFLSVNRFMRYPLDSPGVITRAFFTTTHNYNNHD